MAIQKFLLLLSLLTLFYPSECFDLNGIVDTFIETGFQDDIQKAVDVLTTREVVHHALKKVIEKAKSHKSILSKITYFLSGTLQSIKCDVSYSDCSQEEFNQWMLLCIGCVIAYMHTVDENGKYMSLINNNLAEYLDVQELYLDRLPLDYIPPVIFQFYTNLDSIIYRKTKTTSINARFFPPKSSRLNSINLTDNIFRSLDKDAFLAATNARTVDLSRNEISYIHCDAFKGLAQIKTLKISFNKLRILEDCYFEDLNTLDLLHIDQNEIAEVEDEAFKSLTNLKTLSLKQNAINNINRKTFRGLEKLEDLDLSANRMKILKAETFSELKMIKNLDLSNNIIEVIHKDVFSGVNNLKDLHFQNNKIKRLPAESITNLLILSYLNLTNNFCINDLFYDITEAKKNLELSCEPKPSDCLIPDIKNGRVISGLDDTNITAGELYDDIYPVKVHCDPGYSMLILRESDNLIFCLSDDTSTNQWNKEFMECKKHCLGCAEC